MKKKKIFPAVLLFFSLLAVLIPTVIAPPCSNEMVLASGGSAPMKCHWSAVMSVCLGAIEIVISGLYFWAETKREKILLDVLFGAVGILLALTPTVFIGVCAGAAMACHMVMRPALVVTGVFMAIAGLGNAGINLFVSTQEIPHISV